jgi:hypothetical protein
MRFRWGLALCALSCASDPAEPDVAGKPPTCEAWRAGHKLNDQRYSSPTFALDDDTVLLVGGHFDDRTAAAERVRASRRRKRRL